MNRTLALLLLVSLCGCAPREPFDAAYLYGDIHSPFFKRKGDVYKPVRYGAAAEPFPARKPPSERRVFIVGGSVAWLYGDHADELARMLDRAEPGLRHRVVNCGMHGYDSRRDLRVLRELAGYEPDTVVVLSGNNEEFFGPSDPPAWRVAAARLLFARRMLPASFFRAFQRAAAPGAQAFEQRNRLFAQNLRSMAALGAAGRFRVVYCTLPSLHSGGVPSGESPSDAAFLSARLKLEAGRVKPALKAFSDLAARDPMNPFFAYYKALALERTGAYAEAAREYGRMLELEAMFPRDSMVRCPPSRNALIRTVAKESGMPLADWEAVLRSGSPHGLPGFGQFRDAVHWHRPLYDALSAEIAAADGRSALSRTRLGPEDARYFSDRTLEGLCRTGAPIEKTLTLLAGVRSMRAQAGIGDPADWGACPQLRIHLCETLRRAGEAAKAAACFSGAPGLSGYSRALYGAALCQSGEADRCRAELGEAVLEDGSGMARELEKAVREVYP
ncbi:MAG: SGNH/GDSL hydrolase family protein [Elusimicrobiota bacterium]